MVASPSGLRVNEMVSAPVSLVRVSEDGMFVVVKTRRIPLRVIGMGTPSRVADVTESGTKMPKAFWWPAAV